MQINSDKGLFSAAFIYDGMLLCGEQGKGFIRPADTSLIARESSPLMKCCHLPKKISKSNDFPLKKTKKKQPVEIGKSLNSHTRLSGVTD